MLDGLINTKMIEKNKRFFEREGKESGPSSFYADII